MTQEQLEALYGLVAAARECVRWLGPGKSVDEARLVAALARVEACGADIAVVVELTVEDVRRLDGKPAGPA